MARAKAQGAASQSRPARLHLHCTGTGTSGNTETRLSHRGGPKRIAYTCCAREDVDMAMWMEHREFMPSTAHPDLYRAAPGHSPLTVNLTSAGLAQSFHQ